MKKILFIAQHRRDRSPSQRFRFEQYFEFLEKNGFHCELAALLSERDDQVFYKPGSYLGKLNIFLRSGARRLRDVIRANQYDIIFVQREAFMVGTIFFERLLRKQAKALVFDFDDSVWIQTVSEANRLLGWLKDANKTSKIISLCDLVIAGNPFLAQYANQFNSHVKIIPTTIDTDEYRQQSKSQKSAITVGWSGSTTTVEHFQTAIPALTRIKKKFGDRVDIRLIGDGQYRNESLKIVGLPWRKQTEIQDLSEFDIGIMPLPDTDWARGKCGLKGLQYMALEIPTIMSPVGVNREIIKDGVDGFLATTEDEWVDRISRLIESPTLRDQIGKAGRKVVEERFSVTAMRNHYLQTFNDLTSH